jgi:hypothetical protein
MVEHASINRPPRYLPVISMILCTCFLKLILSYVILLFFISFRWFIAETNETNEGPIVISGLEIRAPNGLRLIELISPNADLLKFWDFSKNPFRLHRFCLNVLDVRLDEDGLPPSVQVQDCRGEILRKDLSL